MAKIVEYCSFCGNPFGSKERIAELEAENKRLREAIWYAYYNGRLPKGYEDECKEALRGGG